MRLLPNKKLKKEKSWRITPWWTARLARARRLGSIQVKQAVKVFSFEVIAFTGNDKMIQ